MESLSLTYAQTVALGQLARDHEPSSVMVTNPAGVGHSSLFVSFYDDEDTLTRHVIDLDGGVASAAFVEAA